MAVLYGCTEVIGCVLLHCVNRMHLYTVLIQGRDDRTLLFSLRKQAKRTHKKMVVRVVFTRKVMIYCAVRVCVCFFARGNTASHGINSAGMCQSPIYRHYYYYAIQDTTPPLLIEELPYISFFMKSSSRATFAGITKSTKQ